MTTITDTKGRLSLLWLRWIVIQCGQMGISFRSVCLRVFFVTG